MNGNTKWLAVIVVAIIALTGAMVAYSEMSEEPDEELPVCKYSCWGFSNNIDQTCSFKLDTSIKGICYLYLDDSLLILDNPRSDSIYCDGEKTVYLTIPDGKTRADLIERLEVRMVGYECVRVS